MEITLEMQDQINSLAERILVQLCTSNRDHDEIVDRAFILAELFVIKGTHKLDEIEEDREGDVIRQDHQHVVPGSGSLVQVSVPIFNDDGEITANEMNTIKEIMKKLEEEKNKEKIVNLPPPEVKRIDPKAPFS